MAHTPPLASPVRVEPVSIERAARAMLSELQSALAAVVEALPDHGVRAVDVQRALGLDKKLGWQLFKFIRSPDPMADLASVPGEPSIRRILTAATRRRVPREITERAAHAFTAFEAFVGEHGGDRAEFISLASGITSSGATDQHHELRIRKAAFKSLVHLWGIRAEMSIRTMAFGPGSPGTEDLVGIRGEIGLQRLRHGVPLTIGMYTLNHPKTPQTDVTTWQVAESLPVSRDAAKSGLHLLNEFCSQPLPRMEPRVQPDGTIETDVVFPPSGRSGAVTLYGAQHVPTTAKGAQRLYSQGAGVRIPCEKLVCELLVPEGWSNPATVRAAVFGRRDRVDRVMERRTVDLLPQRETATYLGIMETAPPIPGVPHHADAVRRGIEMAGWLGTRYDVYRCTVAYPVLHTMISLDVDAANR